MRTRREIELDMREDTSSRQPHDLEADVLKRILEVLLDCRDILQAIVSRMET